MSVLAGEGITAGLSRHKRSDRDLKIPKLLSYAGNSEVKWEWVGCGVEGDWVLIRNDYWIKDTQFEI